MRTTLSNLAVLVIVSIGFSSIGAELHAQTAKGRPQPSAQPAPAAASSASAPSKPAMVVNINTANAEQLEALPGIGAKTAARILDYRQKKGQFKKIEELMNVQGIGEKSFLRLKPQITVGGNAP